MQKLYRALYTRCVNGTNFQSSHSFRDGQKLFSTSGDMGLSSEVLSLIETEIGRDVYNAGLRPYNGEACRFFSCDGTSVLLHYRWMSQEETGSREFGITKALIGDFDNHPIEYLSYEFFNGNDFFFDYPDANGEKITSYKQLLTFQGQTPPPLFKAISNDRIFRLKESYPAMSFEDAGSYILQSKNVAGRLRAVVYHLVKQFSLPENERQGIIIKGTPEQLRYWFASIGYAFSARAAQKIAFNIGLPPTGFAYKFSNAALVGWDIADPDLAKLGNSTPTNLVYLESLPMADKDAYYYAIAKFDDTHRNFISTTRCNEIQTYPDLYSKYSYKPHTPKERKKETHVVKNNTAPFAVTEQKKREPQSGIIIREIEDYRKHLMRIIDKIQWTEESKGRVVHLLQSTHSNLQKILRAIADSNTINGESAFGDFCGRLFLAMSLEMKKSQKTNPAVSKIRDETTLFYFSLHKESSSEAKKILNDFERATQKNSNTRLMRDYFKTKETG